MSDSDSDVQYSKRRPKKKVQFVRRAQSKDATSEENSSASESITSCSEESCSDVDEDDEAINEQPVMKEVVQKTGFVLPGSEEEPKIFVLCGSCASGKSYMLKYIMSVFGKRKQFKFGLCFTSTKFTGDYSYLPDRSVRDFDMNYLESYIKHLRGRIEKGKKENGDKWELPHNFIIIDDSLGLVGNSGFFANFIATHRHTRTSIFLLTQMLTASRSCATIIRANTNYAFLWATAMQNALEGLWKSYGQMMTLSEFKEKLNDTRKRKYSCLVFKNSPDNVTVEDSYTTILAPKDFPDFHLQF